VQDGWSDETRLDRFRDRGVDQVLLAVRKALQAQAEDREQRRDGPFQVPRGRAHGPLSEPNRDEVAEARGRVMQPTADAASRPEVVLRRFPFVERDDAAFVRVVSMDDLAPDGDTDDVRPAEDRVFVDRLRGPHIEGHRHPFRSSALISSRPSPSLPPAAVPATRTSMFDTNPRKMPMP